MLFCGLRRFFLMALMSLVAFPVMADAAVPSGIGASQLFILAGFILIFYFLMWRPQSKRAKEHRELISNITKEDEVVTTGGILGRVVKVTDNFLVISIAEGIEIRLQKNAIAASLPKGTIKSI